MLKLWPVLLGFLNSSKVIRNSLVGRGIVELPTDLQDE